MSSPGLAEELREGHGPSPPDLWASLLKGSGLTPDDLTCVATTHKETRSGAAQANMADANHYVSPVPDVPCLSGPSPLITG